MSRNSAPYRFISSIYNSVVTKLEGGNVNQIEVVHSANTIELSQLNVCTNISYLRSTLNFCLEKSYRSLSEKTRRLR